MDYRDIGIFEGVKQSAHIDAAMAACRRLRLAEGELLLTSGQENHHLYFLISGRMEAQLTRDFSQPGMPIAPGDVIGEMSLIDGRTTSAYVRSLEESEVLALHEDDFWRHLAPMPRVMRNLTRLITHRFRMNRERMIRDLEQQLKFEHLKKELNAARDIQMGLLPHRTPLLPNHPQVDVHAYLLPAKEVGGDLYDVVPVDPDHVLFAVGDVSGKGMPAALFMMRTLTLIRAQGCANQTLEQLLPTLNRLLCEGNETDMFVTLSLAVLSVRDGRLVLLNGGHPPPLLSRAGGAFEVVDAAKGPLLGVIPQARYQFCELTLAPGDRLVLYSDGVTEAENTELDMFTLDRAKDALQSRDAAAGLDELVGALTRAVVDFSGEAEQSDDITILAFRYLGD